MTKPEKYIDDVLTGKIKTGTLARLAVERHVNDLQREDFGYYFDEQEGILAIQKMEAFEHHEGKLIGKPFQLTGWQAFVVYCVFGWKNRENNKRRFKYAYIEIAKKNGKTAFAAIVALYLMMLDGEPNAEIYTFASHKDQAKICFNDCKSMMEHMVSKDGDIKPLIWTGKNALAYYPTASKIMPMSKDKTGGGKKDGIRAHGGICDEYHSHDDNAVFDQVKSSMINRDQPLMWIITTAGFNKLGPCYQYRQSVERILQGADVSDITFGMIFSLDKDDDWQNEENWIKSNPSMDVPGCATLKNLREEKDDALNKGKSFEVNFMTKNLNMWTDAAEVWVNDITWMKNHKPGRKISDLDGALCYGGLDLASGIDFNAFTLFFPEVYDGGHAVLTWYWKPSDLMVDKRHKKDYRQWSAEGYILDTPGPSIDFGVIVEKISHLSGLYDLRSIAYDPHLAHHGAVQGLTGYGIQMHDLAQQISVLSTPTKEMEKLLVEGVIEHYGNPVTRWMMGNVIVVKDANDNIRLHKGKSKGQIDGPASMVNAIAEWMTFRADGDGGGFMLVETKPHS